MQLSQKKKNVFYVINSVITARGDVAKSDEIKGHDLVRDMTQPTFHRRLKNLVNMDLLAYALDTKAVSCVSPQESDDATEIA